MQRLATADSKHFHVRAYAGDTAPDHIDHIHAMPEWLGLLDIE
jgi:hypothetical protein